MTSAVVAIERARGVPAVVGRAHYVLHTSTSIAAPIDDVFGFFSDPRNLALLTPPSMRFAIVDDVPVLRLDARIRYRIRIGGIRVNWLTRIVRWDPVRGFVDVQESGPYAFWWHEHVFREDDASTVMEDRVYYTPPFGVVGRAANWVFVAPSLRRIFRYRG